MLLVLKRWSKCQLIEETTKGKTLARPLIISECMSVSVNTEALSVGR